MSLRRRQARRFARWVKLAAWIFGAGLVVGLVVGIYLGVTLG